jgi:hypothetical protein
MGYNNYGRIREVSKTRQYRKTGVLLYTVNIIYFLKLYSVNIHTVWQSIQAQTCCNYTYHLFLSDLTLIDQQFCNLTPDISGVEWMECALRPIYIFQFGGFMQGGWVVGWNQTNMQKAMSLILSDVVKCVQCIYIVAKALKLVWKYSI